MQRFGYGNDERLFMGKYGYITPSLERRKELEASIVDPIVYMKNHERMLKWNEEHVINNDVSDRVVEQQKQVERRVVVPEESETVVQNTEIVPVEPQQEEVVVENKPSGIVEHVESFVSKHAKNNKNVVEKYCMNHVHQVSMAIVVVLAILFIAMAVMMYSMIMDRLYRRNKLITKLEQEMSKNTVVVDEVSDKKKTVEEVVGDRIEKATVPEITGDNVLTGGAKRPRPKMINEVKSFDFMNECAF
jgi:hypothetical protein